VMPILRMRSSGEPDTVEPPKQGEHGMTGATIP
jgi:hypothetical protein